MNEINALKKEIDDMKSELAAHKILISSLLVHFADSTNRTELISTFSKISESLGVKKTDDSFIKMGYFTKTMLEREKHK